MECLLSHNHFRMLQFVQQVQLKKCLLKNATVSDGHETAIQEIGAKSHTGRRDRYQSKG